MNIGEPLKMDDCTKRTYRNWWYQQAKNIETNEVPRKHHGNKHVKRKLNAIFKRNIVFTKNDGYNRRKVRQLRALLHDKKMEIKEAIWLREECELPAKIPEFDETHYRKLAEYLSHFNKSKSEWMNQEIDEIVDGIKSLSGGDKCKRKSKKTAKPTQSCQGLK